MSAQMQPQGNLAEQPPADNPDHFYDELDINDYPVRCGVSWLPRRRVSRALAPTRAEATLGCPCYPRRAPRRPSRPSLPPPRAEGPPQADARYKALHRDTILRVQEDYGCAIINRGTYVKPGTEPQPGQKRLYLAIEGKNSFSISNCKAEMKRIIEEETRNQALGGPGGGAMANYGKYSLI